MNRNVLVLFKRYFKIFILKQINKLFAQNNNVL